MNQHSDGTDRVSLPGRYKLHHGTNRRTQIIVEHSHARSSPLSQRATTQIPETTTATLEHYRAQIEKLESADVVLAAEIAEIDAIIARSQDTRNHKQVELDAVRRKEKALERAVAALGDPDLAWPKD